MGALIALLLSFHFWFINHAEGLVEDLVHTQSNGKIHLKVKRFKFNWFSHKMEMDQAVFTTTDTTSPASYRFAVKRLKMEVKSVWPIIFEKRFLIDSLQLFQPEITVTKMRTANRTSGDSSLSLPQEMGRVYHSIQDAMQVLKVEQFRIHDGTFALIDKTRPDDIPVRITHLDLRLDNLQVDSTAPGAGQKILFSDNVALQTRHQDILFPDGRHRLSFSNFRINLRNRLAEFDSCTIRATKGDSSNSSFRIFFDKLRMTNIDFDTLYRAEVIKADSVYCINPQFRLDVDLKKPAGPVTPPKLDELIQQLTGDLQVAFVIVENGSFDINTMREGRPSSFTSDHNNFSLQGLRIQKDAPRPLVVDRFAMAIRNYENFLRDSSFSIQFDSILINNNRVSLSSFAYSDLRKNKPDNKVSMRQLELYGLSWDDLIFEQQLKAERVTLFHPVIDYTPADNKKGDLFATLAGIGKVLQLDNLQIVDGQITIRFPNQGKLQLEDANLLIQASKLVKATQPAAIKETVDWLRFKKGTLVFPGFSAGFTGTSYLGGNGQLIAEAVELRDNHGTIINARNVEAASMLFDDRLHFMAINNLRWKQAGIRYRHRTGAAKTNTTHPLLITGIDGTNTDIDIVINGKQITGQLQQVKMTDCRLGAVPRFGNLQLVASPISIKDSLSLLQIDRVVFNDNDASKLTTISYRHQSAHDSLQVLIPSLAFSAQVQKWLDGKYELDYLKVLQPDLKIHFARSAGGGPLHLPKLFIGQLQLQQPSVVYDRSTAAGAATLNWQSPPGNFIELDSLAIDTDASAVSIGSFHLLIEKLTHSSIKGKKINTGKGQVKGHLQQLSFYQNETGDWEWKGRMNELSITNFIVDSVGRHAGTWKIDRAQVNDLHIQSAWLLSLRELVKQNRAFRISQVYGSYSDSLNQYAWYNAGYHKSTRQLTVDSFSYHPTPDLATFTARQQYQADYLTARTGKLTIGPLDIERFIADSILSAGTIQVEDGYLTDYRDKRILREPGIVRKLPSRQLRQLPIKLEADSIKVINAHVEYEEVNEKNNKAGRIAVAQLNGSISNVRNYNLQGNDSLYIQASALLAHHIPTRLTVTESYADSLGGFRMHVDMGAGDLRILNPILHALASAELRSGYLDTLVMEVIGREEMAYGQMKMLYRDLKVKLVQNTPGKRRAFKLGVLNFLVNTVIKNKNTGRSGAVFFRRLRDRSAINYLVKITLSGVMSNVGIKKAQRMARRQAAELVKQPLPPILPQGKK